MPIAWPALATVLLAFVTYAYVLGAARTSDYQDKLARHNYANNRAHASAIRHLYQLFDLPMPDLYVEERPEPGRAERLLEKVRLREPEPSFAEVLQNPEPVDQTQKIPVPPPVPPTRPDNLMVIGGARKAGPDPEQRYAEVMAKIEKMRKEMAAGDS